MNVSSRTRLRGGFRYFKGHFRTRWCLRHVFCGVMHHCVVRRSGSVPTEITEPTLEARSSRHVFIETLQSKDFLAILLICGNFQITAFRMHSSYEPKIIFNTVPHQKQSGHNLFSGVGSLSYMIDFCIYKLFIAYIYIIWNEVSFSVNKLWHFIHWKG